MKIRQSQRRRRDEAKAAASIPAICDCCGQPPNAGKALCLDHDHVTLGFRGWLCHSCNLGIGLLGDSLDGVRKAASYLRRAEKAAERYGI